MCLNFTPDLHPTPADWVANRFFFKKVDPEPYSPQEMEWDMWHVTCDGTTKILLKVRKSRMRAGKTTNTCLFTVREVFSATKSHLVWSHRSVMGQKSHGCGTDQWCFNDRGGARHCVGSKQGGDHNLTVFSKPLRQLFQKKCTFSDGVTPTFYILLLILVLSSLMS